jgi:hypothetical protein
MIDHESAQGCQKKNHGTGIGTGKLGNRGLGFSSGLKKPKTGYYDFDTRFLVSGFYRVTGNRVKYIFFIFYF